MGNSPKVVKDHHFEIVDERAAREYWSSVRQIPPAWQTDRAIGEILGMFCDDLIPQFKDRVPEKPLYKAYYNNRYLETLINNSGWALVSYEPPAGYMMDSFLCQPEE
jgi:hypothetical protein